MGGVEAADIEGRVRFRIAEALRVSENLRESELLRFHAAEDVIASAVEDTLDTGDLIARKRFTQRLDDRDAARDRGLEGERNACLLGRPCELGAVLCEQSLVGGHHGLARLDRGLERR